MGPSHSPTPHSPTATPRPVKPLTPHHSSARAPFIGPTPRPPRPSLFVPSPPTPKTTTSPIGNLFKNLGRVPTLLEAVTGQIGARTDLVSKEAFSQPQPVLNVPDSSQVSIEPI